MSNLAIAAPRSGAHGSAAPPRSAATTARARGFDIPAPEPRASSAATMAMTMPHIQATLSTWCAEAAGFDSLSDDDLVESTRHLEQIGRLVEVLRARHAAALVQRSDHSTGMPSLAARHGYSNALAFVRDLTRTTHRDAAARIRVGEALASQAQDHQQAASAPTPLSPLLDAIAGGDFSVSTADTLLRTLVPSEARVQLDVGGSGHFAAATVALVDHAAHSNADELVAHARHIRDDLDRGGIADRERDLRSKRSLTRSPVDDGLRRMFLVLDPESDAILTGALDAALSPRIGGPRFTTSEGVSRATRLVEDSRTNAQLALDALVELVRIGVDRDDGTLLGSHKPAVRVHIEAKDLVDLASKTGHTDETIRGRAWIEGSRELVSASTARRYLCDSGVLPVVFGGDSEILDLGRTRRLFSSAQRVALAARDGGCVWPGCDRPPSWSEAHHINPFGKQGKTDLADGVLLCRHHHRQLHDQGWGIRRSEQARHHLIPPTLVDPAQRPRPLCSKTPLKRLTPSLRSDECAVT